MLHYLLERYIPSRSYVEYLKERGVSFTEFETAAILHQIKLPVETELSVYRELRDTVKDEKLRRQLAEEIDYIEAAFRIFKTGGEGVAYITFTYEPDYEMIGIGANYETAYEIGVHEGQKFSIEKYALMTEYPKKPSVLKTYLNPNMLKEADKKECVSLIEDDDLSRSLGTFTFGKDGTLLLFYSREADEGIDDNTMLSMLYAPDRFTNAFIEYPNPFELGDVVKYARFRGEYEDGVGVIATSQADWKDFRERVKNGLYADQSDAAITVEWLQRDRSFSHSHNPPIFLEKAELDKTQPWYSIIEAEIVR